MKGKKKKILIQSTVSSVKGFNGSLAFIDVTAEHSSGMRAEASRNLTFPHIQQNESSSLEDI